MARQGLQGSSLTLEVRFYKNGVLFDPLDVSTSVPIYDATVGGTLITTLTAARTGLGIWQATWNIPVGQATGTYYDQWTWQADATLSATSQRNIFTVSSNYTLSPTQNTQTLENRLQAIENALNTMAIAVNNVPTKKEVRAWQTLFQKLLNELDQKIDTHEAVGH